MDSNQKLVHSEEVKDEIMLVEFKLGKEFFGIPVTNVNEILMPSPVISIPRSHAYMEGITDIRGEVLPVIHLATFLSITEEIQQEQDRFIVTEFNDKRVIFHVSGVEQIISVKQIEQPTELNNRIQYVTGIVRNKDRMILMLDFEGILSEMNR